MACSTASAAALVLAGSMAGVVLGGGDVDRVEAANGKANRVHTGLSSERTARPPATNRHPRVNYSWPHETGPYYGDSSLRTSNGTGTVRTMVGTFDLSGDGFSTLPAPLRRDGALDERRARYFLVQLHPETPVAAAQELFSRVTSGDGAIVGKLPVHTFVMRLTRESFDAVRDTVGVTAIEPFHPGLKLAPTLGRTPLGDPVKAASSLLSLEVNLFAGEDVASAVVLIEGLGGKTTRQGPGTVYVDLPQERLTDLANIEAVQAVFEDLPIRPYAEETSTAIQVGGFARLSRDRSEALGVIASGTTPYTDAGIDGGGGATGNTLLLMVLDTGIQLDALDLADTDASAGVPGPLHRKIRLYQTTEAFGGSGDLLGCDDPISGGVTHGHSVTAVAIGNATADFGIAVRNTDVGGRSYSVDGVAPGAAAIVYDALRTPAIGGCDDPLQGALFPGDLYDGAGGGVLEAAFAEGATISNFSWGSDQNLYTANAADIDAFLAGHPAGLVFVAAGNYADDTPFAGFRPPRENTVGTPGVTKNGVAIGAHLAIDDTGDARIANFRVGFSSAGPAGAAGSGVEAHGGSGRVAPLLMAPGDDRALAGRLDSEFHCRSNDNDSLGTVECDVAEGQAGTSLSSAAAAGSALLILDYLQQGFYPDGTAGNPSNASDRIEVSAGAVSGALVKASLIASARMLGVNFLGGDYGVFTSVGYATNDGLSQRFRFNNEQGYGRIQLDRVLPLATWPESVTGLILHDGVGTHPTTPRDVSGLTGSVSAGAVDTGTFEVCDADEELRIAVVWMDSPGDALSNDLDLTVTSPGGQTYIGNFFTDDQDLSGQIDGAEEDCASLGVTGRPWSLPVDTCAGGGTAVLRDTANPTEAVFLSPDPDNDPNTPDSQIERGTWTVSVSANGMNPTSPQAFAVVIAGGVCLGSSVRLDDSTYSCNGTPSIVVTEIDETGDPVAALDEATVTSRLSVQVIDFDVCSDDFTPCMTDADCDGDNTCLPEAAVDFESGSGLAAVFDDTDRPRFVLDEVVLTDGMRPESGNGVLNVRDGARIEVIYADEVGGVPTVGGRRLGAAAIDCSPAIRTHGLKFGQFGTDTPFDLSGGCERNARGQFEFGFPDLYMDAGETVAYAFAIGSGQNRDLWNLQAQARCVEIDADSPESCRPGTADCADPDRANNPPCINEFGFYVDIRDATRTLDVLPPGQTVNVRYTVSIPRSLDLAADPQPEIEMLLELTAPTTGGTVAAVVANRHRLNVDETSVFYSTDFPNGGTELRDGNNNDVIEDPTSTPEFESDYVFETRTFGALTANGKNAGLQSPWNFDTDDGGFTTGVTAATNLSIPDILAQWGEDLNFDGIVGGTCADAPSQQCDRFPLDPVQCPSGPAAFECVNVEDRDPTNAPVRLLDQNWSTLGGCGYQTRAPGTCTLDSTVGCYTNDDCAGLGGCDSGAPQAAGGVWHTGRVRERTATTSDCLFHGDAAGGDCQTFEVISGDDGQATWHEILVTPEMQKVSDDPDVRVEVTWWAWNQSIDLPDNNVGYTWEVDTDTAAIGPTDLFADLIVLNSGFGEYGSVTNQGNAALTNGFSLFAPVRTVEEAGGTVEDAVSVNGTVGNNRHGRNACFFEFGELDGTDINSLGFAGPPDDDATNGFCAGGPDSELDGIGDQGCTWVCSVSGSRCTVDVECPTSETCVDADPVCEGAACIRASSDPQDVDRYVEANGPLRNAIISDRNGPDMRYERLEDLYGETGDTFRAAIGMVNFESDSATAPLTGFGLAVDDMVFEWREVTESLDVTDCETGQCAVLETGVGAVFDGNAILEVTLLESSPYGRRCSADSDTPNAACFVDADCPGGACAATSNDCDGDGDYFGAEDDMDCDDDGVRDIVVVASTEVELNPGEPAILNQTAEHVFQGSVTVSTNFDLPGILFGAQQGTDLPTVTIDYEDIDDGAGSHCLNDVMPGQSGRVSTSTQIAIVTANVVVSNVSVEDGLTVGTAGDRDGFADEGETVDLHVELTNNTGQSLTGIAVRLTTLNGDPDVDCVLDSFVNAGSLAVGETRLIASDAFRVRLADDVRSAPPIGDGNVLAGFFVTIEADQLDATSRPQTILLPLDLDASGGGFPTTFSESFETGTLGSFTSNAIDFGLGDFGDPDGNGALVRSDGYRCQYHDPDWVNSGSFSNIPDCYLNATGAADVYYWQTTADRAFAGLRSLYWGIPLNADLGFTTPLARLQAVERPSPINLGYDRICEVTRSIPCLDDADCPASETCTFASPKLSFKHQASMLDSRSVGAPFLQSGDRGVAQLREVGLDGNPTSDWQRLSPVTNLPDQVGVSNYFQCTYDPIDDGHDEDSFFDPGDPDRNTGPSSTCFPEGFSFVNLGNTDGPFDPDDLGNADGPGLEGAVGEGTWVESVFPLSTFRGKRIQLRFVATGIKVGSFVTYEDLFAYNPDPGDDGWWIDDVEITDTLTTPATLSEDLGDPALLPACGSTCGQVVTHVQADPATLAAPGRAVELSAVNSTADRCIDGLLQFQFWRDANFNSVAGDAGDTLLRDFSSDPVFVTAPTRATRYVVRTRCATETSCQDDGAVTVSVDCPSASPFDSLGGPIRSVDGGTLNWPLAVQSAPYAVGNLSQVSSYTTISLGTVSGTSVSIAADVPLPNDGLYYLIKETGALCNEFSWSSDTTTPTRDSTLP